MQAILIEVRQWFQEACGGKAKAFAANISKGTDGKFSSCNGVRRFVRRSCPDAELILAARLQGTCYVGPTNASPSSVRATRILATACTRPDAIGLCFPKCACTVLAQKGS